MRKLILSLALALSSTIAQAQVQTISWRPDVTTTWQWQLTGKLNLTYNVGVYDLDLFDTPQATIDSLHAQGRKVICYFSAGSAENWRPDYNKFTAADLGSPLAGWAGERWVKITSTNVRSIMAARIKLAVSRKCDGVEPDNVDGYSNSNGLNLTATQQLDYNRFLATQARTDGLAVALKNDVEQVPDLYTYFDLAINEQCHEYSECGNYSSFINSGKPVFNAEYARNYKLNTNGARTTMCAAALNERFQTLVLPLTLDGSFRISC